MSIILKGIDMPKSCGGCEFVYNLVGGSYEWWECVILHDDINQFDTRRTDCPLIEIPTPHGRIIDKNEIQIEWITIDKGGGGYYQLTAPTILEEEP